MPKVNSPTLITEVERTASTGNASIRRRSILSPRRQRLHVTVSNKKPSGMGLLPHVLPVRVVQCLEGLFHRVPYGIRHIGTPYFQERSRAARPRCLDRHYFHLGALWESHPLV